MKKFLTGTAKITISLVLSGTLIALAVDQISKYQRARERQEETRVELETKKALGAKEWPEIDRPDVGVKFSLTTKWIDGKARYHFMMSGKQNRPLKNMMVVLKDEDGFLIYGKNFGGELFMDYPGGGKPSEGILNEGTFNDPEMTKDAYLSIGQWDVMWKDDFEKGQAQILDAGTGRF